MKRFLRVLLKLTGYGAVSLLALILVALAVVFLFFPRSAPPSREPIAASPARLERGSYLVNHVGGCLNCHSERDWNLYSGPVKPGTAGGGAYVTLFGKPYAYSANLTPTGLHDWSDGEVVRAMTSGVRNDGTALHPLMSYDTYSHLGQEDVYAIVTYLRTLPPVQNNPPRPKLGLVMGVLARVLPQPWKPQPAPSPADSVAYGRYLVTFAECDVCHGLKFSGGHSFQIPGQEKGLAVVSSNITPDKETGIGTLSRESFIGRFKAFASPESQRIPVPAGKANTVMPWVQYAGMTEQDLGAIFDYLRTLPAVKKAVAGPPQPPGPAPKPAPQR
jgi:mono/diheme cytochrome c family protein